MKVIGITGLMGAGKTQVCQYLETKGYPVIYADELGHQALEKESPIYFHLLKEFGTNKRNELAKIVFSQPEKLKKLEALSHPVILNLIQKDLNVFRKLHYPIVFIEAAVLFKMNAQKLCDQTWLVEAPEKVLLARLQKKGLGMDEILKRLKSNPLNVHRQQIQAIIQNDGMLEDLHRQIDLLINKL